MQNPSYFAVERIGFWVNCDRRENILQTWLEVALWYRLVRLDSSKMLLNLALKLYFDSAL
jgi:hypothetical protein